MCWFLGRWVWVAFSWLLMRWPLAKARRSEEAAFALFPVAAFAFGEAALVSFFTGFAVFFVGEAAAFGFGEDFGRGVI